MSTATVAEVLPTLAENEAVIARAERTFLDVGVALTNIHGGKQYQRAADENGEKFTSFEDYCADRWGMKRRYAYYLMEAAEVCTFVHSIPNLPSITKESQARALVPVFRQSPDEVAPVLRVAADATGGNPTAAAITEAFEALPEVRKAKREKARKKREREAARAGVAAEEYDPDDPDTAFAECAAIVGDITARSYNAIRAEMALHLLNDQQVSWLVGEVRKAAADLIDHITKGALP